MTLTLTPTAGYDPVALKAELTTDEGRRALPYRDTTGNETVGIGHNLSIPQSAFVIDAIYECDRAGCEASLDLHLPWWRGQDPVRQRLLMNLIFNMGWGDGHHGLSTFTNTLKAMEMGHYTAAAQGLLNSKWAGEVHDRAKRLAAMMIAGSPPVTLVASTTTPDPNEITLPGDPT